ncbi:MAG: hypothetical protein GDA51_04050 [Ekhidna sp.]|nr:hypothetical protein [Ekhidna sp.]MBC6409484.1 hypothetical protein [Ekhidna sp.]MBC6425639.1 hypothetical protein [Ekhidna sp.]
MKKSLSTNYLLVAFVTFANAQFHVELGTNFNSPQDHFANLYNSGTGAYIEPKYTVSKNLDLGLLIAGSVFRGADFDQGGISGSAEALGAFSILPTGTYRFVNGSITPYTGLGLGVYSFEAPVLDIGGGNTIEGDSKTEFGTALRAGVYLGIVNLGAVYHLIQDTNFIQINLGFRIGGRG